jgi:hypothetical protein
MVFLSWRSGGKDEARRIKLVAFFLFGGGLIRCNSVRDTVQAQHKHIPRERNAQYSRDGEPQSSPSFAFKFLGVHGSPDKKVSCRDPEGGCGAGGVEATELRTKCRRANVVPRHRAIQRYRVLNSKYHALEDAHQGRA